MAAMRPLAMLAPTPHLTQSGMRLWFASHDAAFVEALEPDLAAPKARGHVRSCDKPRLALVLKT